jgi:hypothetical protein
MAAQFPTALPGIEALSCVFKNFHRFSVVDESKQQKNPRLRKMQFLEICSASCNI